MQYDEIIARVVQRTGLFKGDAVALTRATLATLAERISGGEARELAARPTAGRLAPNERRGRSLQLRRVREPSG